MTNEEKINKAYNLLSAIVEMGDGSGIHGESVKITEWLIVQAKILESIKDVQERLDTGEIDGFDFGDEVYHILDSVY